VVDCTTAPAKILYRKDLTSLGWPLPVEIQKIMRSGQPPPLLNNDQSNTAFGAAANQASAPK
jgi:hypothetical protein